MDDAPSPVEFLPDFCTGARVVRVLIVCEAVAVVLTLGVSLSGAWVERLFLLSVYLQWIGICSAAALCLIRRYAAALPANGVVVLAYLTLLSVTFAITELTLAAGPYAGFDLLFEDASHLDFLLRSVGICAVVSALALRYFWLRSAWQQQAQAELRIRLEALQARIEPHFLFNSLNSVAALIATQPEDAEQALEDLSALLRARLSSNGPDTVSLAEEMTLVDAYVRVESLRLGDRLMLDTDIEAAARSARLPAFTVQPLVENAIGHGVARLARGGVVRLSAALAGDRLCIRVDNPLAVDTQAMPGNRQALVNIRNRLALRYGNRARLTIRRDRSRFEVTLDIPQAGDRTRATTPETT